MEIQDTYFTINKPATEVLYKEKNSKFFGYTFPITSEEDVKRHIENLKKQHFSARHWCYAYQIGTDKIQYRANDDGEPNNSAGMPIYGQIQSYNVTNILVVVVRYFGGIKLGVGGLITAYKTTAQMALDESEIIEKTINIHFVVGFDYKNMNKVMRVIKEKNITIVSQKMEESCQIEIASRKKNASSIFDIFDQIFEVEIKKVND
ncbi:YigZ family protein [Flavobacterium psychrophilum]|uniref:YigZ family protein n=1 Tax=Flavobacterium psychrophilum TaxID=96345 RepID=A0A7U2RC09_FLAPS|nr:YigZ family protein [Flavobacterium psychrophilum]EKT4509560.1 YigZ family protein [Flavobacterium psychrophilum]ELM3649152.1 YigZ family protein [Flavobacterium psychrophilum]ELM3670788.1 YigZ family protein [Flavobacterium psychrophilum]ELM3724711.1 YigZ family protein [Flavobacterium psychrophilum]ELY1990847.1 YigZ family protein [Flavobacterium psychrophilum]